jgi:sugar lactone lactonase YvrE
VAGQLNVVGRAVGTGTQNTFTVPLTSSIDSSGNVYIVNTYAHCITKLIPPNYVGSILSGGTFTAGNATGTSTTATFNFPIGCCIYDGFLYVCDEGSGFIRKVSLADGSVTNFSTTAGASNMITSDGAGNFFYTRAGTNDIFRITSAGVHTTYATAAQTGATNGISGLAYNSANGDIYYSDTRPGNGTSFIRRITTGLVQNVIDSSLTFPVGIKISSDNTTVYYAVANQQIIKRFVIGGAVSILTGASGVPGSADSTTLTSARYSSPYDISIDTSGLFLYVNDQGNQLFRRVVL